MRGIHIVTLYAALSLASAATAEKTACPPREMGQSYPWESSELMRGDKYAWIYIDVDRDGWPLQCKIGDNNVTEYMRFQLCNAYTKNWRAPAASQGDPDHRTLKRYTLVISSAHQLANENARRAWFKQHPDERPACYPE